MHPTACLFFLLIISVSLKKDITSFCRSYLHCSQHRREEGKENKSLDTRYLQVKCSAA